MNEMVILVDKHDNQLGLMEKIEAHKKAVLHRAFSVFILNDNNELLIQQRALSKYHSPALWTNTCCSHPRDGESVLDAGARRLKEEMGFETKLDSLLSFIYRAKFDNGLTEHEFDHVLFGYYNDDPSINKLEVMDWKWVNLDFLKNDIITNSDLYTIWFKIIFEKFYKNFNK
ncbi:isopentenyl-diphosphate Delta-isomerase [Flavobacteriaceae bacterium]|nr:isopentenyl-diphosphate Delta-isomerase [Flavobacteriaceae bacterium]|tara:strand:- start:1258 stop:1773 length:516 start_codon:yes stop_codon:yes gene_type:complete